MPPKAELCKASSEVGLKSDGRLHASSLVVTQSMRFAASETVHWIPRGAILRPLMVCSASVENVHGFIMSLINEFNALVADNHCSHTLNYYILLRI